jgi:hypothetical protein
MTPLLSYLRTRRSGWKGQAWTGGRGPSRAVTAGSGKKGTCGHQRGWRAQIEAGQRPSSPSVSWPTMAILWRQSGPRTPRGKQCENRQVSQHRSHLRPSPDPDLLPSEQEGPPRPGCCGCADTKPWGPHFQGLAPYIWSKSALGGAGTRVVLISVSLGTALQVCSGLGWISSWPLPRRRHLLWARQVHSVAVTDNTSSAHRLSKEQGLAPGSSRTGSRAQAQGRGSWEPRNLLPLPVSLHLLWGSGCS